MLSTEFGLIAATTPIPDYNRKMSPARAAELAPQVAAQFAQLVRPYEAEGFAHALICAGKVYLTARRRLRGRWPPSAGRRWRSRRATIPAASAIITPCSPPGSALAEPSRHPQRPPGIISPGGRFFCALRRSEKHLQPS